MDFRAIDMERMSGLLKEQLDNGNKWATYVQGLLYTHVEGFHFFKTEDEAIQYCVANDNEFDDYRYEEVEPLYNVMQEALKKYEGRQDIEFFWIDPPDDIDVRVKMSEEKSSREVEKGNVIADTNEDDNLLVKKRDNNGKGIWI